MITCIVTGALPTVYIFDNSTSKLMVATWRRVGQTKWSCTVNTVVALTLQTINAKPPQWLGHNEREKAENTALENRWYPARIWYVSRTLSFCIIKLVYLGLLSGSSVKKQKQNETDRDYVSARIVHVGVVNLIYNCVLACGIHIVVVVFCGVVRLFYLR